MGAHSQPRLGLPRDATAPLLARRHLAGVCTAALGTDPPEWVDDAGLVVSELVTNALRHGVGSMSVEVVRLAADSMRVEVRDDTGKPPELRRDEVLAEGGRGLQLVDLLTSAWGWEHTASGKVVWFEIGDARAC